MIEDVLALIVRSANWVAWIFLCILVLWVDQPVSRMARQIICLVLIFGMTVFEVGGIVPFGFPRDTARFVSTAFAGFALLAAIMILWTTRPRRP